MTRLLLVEDQPRDVRAASDVAQSAGFTSVEARTSAMAARLYLEKGLEGEHPLPEAIVMDLDLGYESGFELLRFWHSNQRLFEVPVIVWTKLGEEHREICRLFKVTAFISKTEDIALLKNALASLEQKAS